MTPERIVRMCEHIAEGHRRRDIPAEMRRAEYEALIQALKVERTPFTCIHDNFSETCPHCNAWDGRVSTCNVSR